LTWEIPFKSLASSLSPEYVRKELRTMLIGSICAMNLFVLLVTEEQRAVVSDWLVKICASAVVAVSITILYRQKLRGLYGRTYGVFAIGLLLWFSAEVLSSVEHYRMSEGAISSVSWSLQPLMSDFIWLAGYGFFAYFLFRTMIHFSKSIKPQVLVLLSVITVFAALILAQPIGYYYGLRKSVDDGQVGITDSISLFLKIEYPILDVLLIIPALVILSGVKRGKLTSTPWILLASAVLMLAIGDIGNIYFSILHLAENHWIWKMFATAGYLCIATSLFWYNRFFIFDPKKAAKSWQQSNR
jgi:hypothetical protein